jgi:ADP-heptose:LPS heptosyltransferase
VKLQPQKILIVLHGSIGDVARAIPLANLVRRGFPRATITWSIERAALPLIEHHPAVDEILLFEREHWRRSLRLFLHRIRELPSASASTGATRRNSTGCSTTAKYRPL